MKRITVFCGHYGSGKTNIAVNYAISLKNDSNRVSIVDLDIVNPYFRTKDSEKELSQNNIELICSDFAGSNLDIPALPAEIYRPLRSRDELCVFDVGGDDRGAVALGRFSELIQESEDWEMLFVVNLFRPLTRTARDALEVMREIENACSLKFTGIVNNSNLGESTTAEDILGTEKEIERLCEMSGLRLKMTTVKKELLSEVSQIKGKVFPMKINQIIH